MAVKLKSPFVVFCKFCDSFGFITHYLQPKKYFFGGSGCGHYYNQTPEFMDHKKGKKLFLTVHDQKRIRREFIEARA